MLLGTKLGWFCLRCVTSLLRPFLVLDVKMSATCRHIVSALISLLLMVSGPTLAISKVAKEQTSSAVTTNCDSLKSTQAKGASSFLEAGNNCIVVADMSCPGPSGTNNCNTSFNFVFLPAGSGNLASSSSCLRTRIRAIFYQDPFLVSLLPPPKYRS